MSRRIMSISGSGGSAAPTGAAGGDLGGTYPNPTAVAAHWTQTTVNFAASPYTALATDTSLNVTAVAGNVVVNLPAATGTGKQYFIIKTDSGPNTVTISRAGADTIEGATSVVLSSQYDSLLIEDSQAASWLKVSPKTPGSPGQLTYNSSGIPGGLTGSTVDVLTDVSSGNSNIIGLARTYTVGHVTNAIHAIDTQITYTGSAKENTFAGGLYARTLWAGTGGGGHVGNLFLRNYDNGVSATAIDTYDSIYSDFQFFGSATATNPITQATHFHAVQGTIQGATAANVWADLAGYRYDVTQITAPSIITIESGAVIGMPAVSAGVQRPTFYGVRIGGAACASKYSAMCVDGGTSYFKQPFDQTMTLAAAPSAPLTNGGLRGFNVSNFLTDASTVYNHYSLLTHGNGGTGTSINYFGQNDNGGNATATKQTVFQAKITGTGGVTSTKAIGFEVLAAVNNSQTTTDISGLEIASLAAGTNTNQPQAIKQTGATDISTFAGPIYWNGNRTFVTSTEFTTSGSGTALETITGASGPAGGSLGLVLPTNTAENVSFSCYFIYHQNVGTAAVAFGVKNSVSPTSMNVSGAINTSATAFTAANLLTLASTTATAVVSATPSVITTNWNAELHGFVENPSGAANTITFLVSTATAADTVTIKRGSYCVLGA